MLYLVFICAFTLAPTAVGADGRPLTRKEQAAARKIYEARCARCHRLYEPGDYAEEEWRLWMTRMTKKARLNSRQSRLLNRFLDAQRAERSLPRTPRDPAVTPQAGGCQHGRL